MNRSYRIPFVEYVGSTQGKTVGGNQGKTVGGTQGKTVGGTQGKTVGGTQGKTVGGTQGAKRAVPTRISIDDLHRSHRDYEQKAFVESLLQE